MIKKGLITRKKRVRSKLAGVTLRPRLVVSRSNKNIYAQIVDSQGKTVVSFSSEKVSKKDSVKSTKTEIAGLVGENVAKLALAVKIKSVVFDRSGYRYHGRIKALADGARKAGLIF